MFNIRKTDIKKRKLKVDAHKEERAEKMRLRDERDIAKKAKYEEEKQEAEDQEKDFIEEEFEQKFLESYPEVSVSYYSY